MDQGVLWLNTWAILFLVYSSSIAIILGCQREGRDLRRKALFKEAALFDQQPNCPRSFLSKIETFMFSTANVCADSFSSNTGTYL